ncbi:hypothetical protein N0V88_000083 [Collariella sp. IMI 366227]|nr:hypothetical protein N0V88_000083 [Collariella sp. IMI 366227]
MSGPQLLSRRPNGVTAGHSSNDAPRAPRIKAPAQGEKVVVRRLPPGLTEDEFVTILGDEWRVGRGKVDWFSYLAGKVSKHVEFSIYKKIPSDKKRVDGRQGTIDQDPEFMAFLEALANPDAQKEAADEAGDETKEKTTTTPLVEYLKERKAAKAKEIAAAKIAKQHARQDSQVVKGKAVPPPEEPKRRTRDGRHEREKASERVLERPKESVRILTKKAAAAAEAAAEAAKAVAAQIKPAARSSTQPEAQEPPSKNRRAGIAAAARILQRDLGLSPGNAHRKARQEAAKAEADAKATAVKEAAKPAPPVPAPSRPATPAETVTLSTSSKAQPPASGRSRNRKRGGAEETTKAKADTKPETKPAPTPAKTPITVLKKQSGALARAMAASPVVVAQATVQVLERKEMGGGGGGQQQQRQQQQQGRVVVVLLVVQLQLLLPRDRALLCRQRLLGLPPPQPQGRRLLVVVMLEKGRG